MCATRRTLARYPTGLKCFFGNRLRVCGENRKERHSVILVSSITLCPKTKKSPKLMLRGLLVAPTGVDPVTFRFSVERSTN